MATILATEDIKINKTGEGGAGTFLVWNPDHRQNESIPLKVAAWSAGILPITVTLPL